MTWFALRVTPDVRRDAVIAALFDAGAEGVQEDGALVTTHFPSEEAARAAWLSVQAVDAAARCEIAPVPDVDWSLAWRDRARAFSIGSLSIAPPWLATGLDPARTVIIEPGMAFGTGDHPSTRGAGRLLEAAMSPGLVVADLGTGSAVLAIAAARLGASRVFAIELDPDALENARENIVRNDAERVVHLFDGDAAVLLPLVGPVDVVVANIISSTIASLLGVMAAALPAGGLAILAGMLASEREDMRALLSAGGWRVDNEDLEEDWWGVLVRRP